MIELVGDPWHSSKSTSNNTEGTQTLAITIAAVNRKGGVGKTSMTFHLGGYFASVGYRVLLVDNDPQHSLTSGLYGPRFPGNRPKLESIAAAFSDADLSAADIVLTTPIEGISLLPGDDSLEKFNRPVSGRSGNRVARLDRFLTPVGEIFDIVLIDNPPNLQTCTFAALTAADFALCVSQPEDYGSQGGVAVREAIDAVQATQNPDLKFLGYLLNMVSGRLVVHRAYEEGLRKTYGCDVFATVVPQLAHFKEAVAARRPISFYRPRSRAAHVIEQLAAELMARAESLTKADPAVSVAGSS